MSDDLYRYLLLDAPDAEEFFCKEMFDLTLEPYQSLMMKLIRGRLKTEDDLAEFFRTHDIDYVIQSDTISFSPGSYLRFVPHSPYAEIMAPGGMGKTTVLNLALAMEACDNPNSRNQCIFKNAREGYACSGSVRNLLRQRKVVEVFGRFEPTDRSKQWSREAFSVEQRQISDLRANFEFYGVNSDDALGKRSDKVYIDDAETTDTARTQDACDKIIEWVNTGPMTSPRPLWAKDSHGKALIPQKLSWSNTASYWGLVNLGTIFHPRGLHAKFQNDPRFTVLRLDCYRDKECTQSINPKMMSVEDLEKERRSIGTLVFNKRYRNIAYDPAEMAFQEVWLKGGIDYSSGREVKFPGCLDPEHEMGWYDPEWDLYLGFDPATGSTSRFAAYSAYVVIGVDRKHRDNLVHVVDVLKVQVEHSRQLDYLLDGNPDYGIEGFFSKYPLKMGTVEKNNHGWMLLGDDRTAPYCQKGLISPSFTEGRNKLDPVQGVFGMAGMVEDGRLRIPYAQVPTTQEKAFLLIDDMVQFPKVKSDLVMALWLAQIPANKDSTYRSWFTKGGRGKFVRNPHYDF